jgi:hypothetical protein
MPRKKKRKERKPEELKKFVRQRKSSAGTKSVSPAGQRARKTKWSQFVFFEHKAFPVAILNQ